MPLLLPDEREAHEIVNPSGASPFVLLCDHASRTLPRALGTLGLSPSELDDHIAWDIGAADVARALSAALDAPLTLSGYSRLAIDCNRPLDVAASIPEETCQVAVPGNVGISAAGRTARQDELFWPYHRAIEKLLAERDERGVESVIISVHSFTPGALFGKARPWHIGVMCGKDRRLADPLLALLSQTGLCVGDNEPYRVTDGSDYGIPTYAERRGRLGVLIELRQDEVATASGAGRLAAILARALPEARARVVEARSVSGGGIS